MAMLASAHVTHVSYVLILYSFSFLLFLFVSQLLHLYAVHVHVFRQIEPQPASDNAGEGRMNGHVDRRVRDAEEFELEGLISDDEEGVMVKTRERLGLNT